MLTTDPRVAMAMWFKYQDFPIATPTEVVPECGIAAESADLECSMRVVRDVSVRKVMLCASFRLPSRVAFSIPGVAVGVINVMGRVFMTPLDDPFAGVLREIEAVKREAAIVFVDFHAEATSEKVAMGWHLDGRVTAMVGTHTHVQTADERVLPKGTAYITDVGMTGPHDSVIGVKAEQAIYRMRTRNDGQHMHMANWKAYPELLEWIQTIDCDIEICAFRKRREPLKPMPPFWLTMAVIFVVMRLVMRRRVP